MSVSINDQRARIYYEQKVLEYGFVYLGAQFEDIMPALTLPADSANGRLEEYPIYGFTDDAQVVALYDEFRRLVDDGKVREGMTIEA